MGIVGSEEIDRKNTCIVYDCSDRCTLLFWDHFGKIAITLLSQYLSYVEVPPKTE